MNQKEQGQYYKRRLLRLLCLIANYWIIIISFTIASILFGHADFMPGNFNKFMLNFFIIQNSYNGAWWYIGAYILLVILSPLIIKITSKYNVYIISAMGCVIYCLGYYLRFYSGNNNWLTVKTGCFAMTLFEYLLGMVCYKYRLISRLYYFYNKTHKIYRTVISVMIILLMLYVRTRIIPSLFVAPLTGMIIILLFHFWRKSNIIEKVFTYIGEHSTNIWLTHMFFYTGLFVNLVYKAKYPILIYAFMLFIELLISNILLIVQKPITNQIMKML